MAMLFVSVFVSSCLYLSDGKETATNNRDETGIVEADGSKDESDEELQPPAKGADKKKVRIESGSLMMRDAPSQKDGKSVFKLINESEVTIIGCQKMSMSIDGKKGRWCKVKADRKIGWVFDAYLVNFSQKAEKTSPKPKEPSFKDYPAGEVYKGEIAKLVLDTVGRQFETRLTKALENGRPSFAGKFIVASWGCGTSGCNTGAIIDAETGKAYAFPVSISSVTEYDSGGLAKGDYQEHEYRLDSRLMKFAGNLEGTENTDGDNVVEYYEFKDNKFIFVKSIPYLD